LNDVSATQRLKMPFLLLLLLYTLKLRQHRECPTNAGCMVQIFGAFYCCKINCIFRFFVLASSVRADALQKVQEHFT